MLLPLCVFGTRILAVETILSNIFEKREVIVAVIDLILIDELLLTVWNANVTSVAIVKT